MFVSHFNVLVNVTPRYLYDSVRATSDTIRLLVKSNGFFFRVMDTHAVLVTFIFIYHFSHHLIGLSKDNFNLS